MARSRTLVATALALCSCASPQAPEEHAERHAALGTQDETPSWVRLGPPPSRTEHAIAYDEIRERAVTFGGTGPIGRLHDTWEWGGDFWALRQPTDTLQVPSSRSGLALAYDAARRRVVLFGGADATGSLGDTWQWNGLAWSHADTSAGAPSARTAHALAYDRARSVVVLFGGHDGAGTSLGDTWEWNGTTWSQRSDAGPSARAGHALAYDEARGRTLLFGGATADASTALADTWQWDGTTWQAVATTSAPPARSGAALVFDAARGAAVLFGGSAAADTPLRDTWEWDGASWSDHTPTAAADSPSARSHPALAYDRLRERITLFAGRTATTALRDTWEWDGTRWTTRDHAAYSGGAQTLKKPSGRAGASLVGDAALGGAVLFGGVTLIGNTYTADNTTWFWDGSFWLDRSAADTTQRPPVRQLAAMAYDSARDRVVLFGGYGDDDVLLADTWEWDRTSWTQRTPATSPSARFYHAMAYDAARGVTVLGGGLDTATPRSDLWEWNGTTWTERAPATNTAPPFDDGGRFGHALVYDPVRERVVQYGGLSNRYVWRATWEWDGSTWTERTPEDAEASAPPRYGAGAAYDPARGRIVLFGGYSVGGTVDDTWEWDGASWSRLVPSNALENPSARFTHQLAYDPVQRRPFLYGGLSHFAGGNQVLTDDEDLGYWLFRRGGPCTDATDSTTGFCVDGVSCLSSSCGSCERCDDPSAPGVCSPVRGNEDPDSCPASGQQRCNNQGICTLQAGAACDGAAACETGFCVAGAAGARGVCCESTCGGACESCRASENVADRDGICAPVKSGLDPNEACPDDGALTCKRDGACDGAGSCRLYSAAACGAASCLDERVLHVPGGTDVSCAPYSCVEDHCRTSCASVADCAADAVCGADGRCTVAAAHDNDDDGSGCSCRTAGTRGGGPAPWLLGFGIAVVLARRRRARQAGAVLVATLAASGCAREPEGARPQPQVTRAALATGDRLRWDVWGNPNRRTGAGVVYADSLHGLVLFGGNAGGDFNSYGDTWLRRGTAWFERRPLLGQRTPPRRIAPAITYDSQRQRVVLFGGTGQFGALGDTWEWDGLFWRDRTPSEGAATPPAREGAALAFDRARGRTVLFGGRSEAMLGDTWEWDGVRWLALTPTTSPTPRTEYGLGYDPDRRRVLLFGGRDDSTALGDTWDWDGATWTQRATSSISKRARPGLAYDVARHRAVLFGGQGAALLGDTWELDGDTWSKRAPTGEVPIARAGHALAYDADRSRVVLSGGLLDAYDSWEWDGSAWTRLSPADESWAPPWRYFHVVAYDEARDRMVMFGGNDDGQNLDHRVGDTWEWNGARWTNLTPTTGPGPAPRDSAGLVYDRQHQRVVLFGGRTSQTTMLGDTWEWDGSAWTERTPSDPAASPPARYAHGLVYDDARQRVVAFAGVGVPNGAAGYRQDLWAWDGTTWTDITPATSPPPRTYFGLAYDVHRDRLVLSGGRSAAGSGLGTINDTWEFDGAAWSNVTASDFSDTTGNNALHTLVYDPFLARAASFGGYQSGPTDSLYTRETGPWMRREGETGGPSPRFGQGAVYSPALRGMLVYSGSETTSDTWLLSSFGAPCTNSTDSSTGYCVDGVSCDTAACAPCERCDSADAPGHCSAITLGEDADTCRSADGHSCDAVGRCRPELGAACSADLPCAAGQCVDGVCCDSACEGICVSCHGSDNVLGRDGVCAPTKAGADPEDRCPDDGIATCQRDGTCNGAGACRLYDENVCGAAKCEDERTLATGSQKRDCAPYVCEGSACKTTCASVEDCVGDAICDAAGECTAPLGAGANEGGCSCRSTASLSPGSVLLALVVLGALRRRRYCFT